MSATAFEHSEDDEAIVAAQLGRSPRGSWTVATRCHLGVPMVIENHPRLEDGTPFPTLYWLTCPILTKRVGRLEMEGAMTVLNQRLAQDGGLRQRLQATTERVIARRNSYEELPDQDPPPGGGAEHIKCLHAHVAQELALPPDPVGALAMAGTGWPDCVHPCYEVGGGEKNPG